MNLHIYRQCCSGSKLVDWVISQSTTPRTRPQVVQMWQALLTEGVLQHGMYICGCVVMMQTGTMWQGMLQHGTLGDNMWVWS